MIAHAARETALAALLSTISAQAEGSDPSVAVQVEWTKDKQAGGFIDPATQALVTLSTVSSVDIGEAEVSGIWDDEAKYEGEAGSFSDQVVRWYVWTVRVKAEALDATPDFQALAWCERMRTRLNRRSSRRMLNTIDCGFQYATSSVDLSAVARTVGNRSANVAAFDLVLNTCDVDMDPERYPEIRTAEIGGAILESEEVDGEIVVVETDVGSVEVQVS